MKPRFAEFFAGAGMVRAAFRADWDLAFANDIDAKKCIAYRTNWGPDNLIEGDVAHIDPKHLRQPIDLYWASSPCQDLSLAGARKGLSGARSGVFHTWMDRVDQAVKSGFAPRILAFENVTGLITSSGGKDFEAVAAAFLARGYRYGALEIDAIHFLPQSRPRVFMVGVRDDVSLNADRCLTKGSGPFHTKRLRSFVEGLPESLRSGWVWWNVPAPPPRNVTLKSLIETDMTVGFSNVHLLNTIAMMDEPSLRKLQKAQELGGLHFGTIYKRGRPDKNGQVRQRAEVRMDGIAGCLRTPAGGSSRQTLVIVRNGDISMRLLTAREAVRLMGLPDSYWLPASYNDAYRLAGDGVAVPVVRHLKQHLFEPLLAAQTKRVAA